MRTFRKMAVWGILLCTLAGLSSAAAQTVWVKTPGIVFQLPDGWLEAEVTPEAAQNDVVFAAQQADGELRLVILWQERKSEQRLDKLLEHYLQGENVVEEQPVQADETEFIVCTEVCSDRYETVTFRVATAERPGHWLHFVFIDQTGQNGQTARDILTSYRSAS